MDPEENLRINFPVVNTDKHVKGVIIDISFGGVAFQLDKAEDTEFFIDGQYINNVQFKIKGKIAIARCQVVAKKKTSNDEHLAALKFIGMNPNAKTIIARYIHDKLIATW